MNKRIRYVKTNNPEVLESVRSFLNRKTNVSYRVVLDLTNKRFRILNAADNAVVMEAGKTRNVAVLKIQAKTALSSLGIDFSEEKRNREVKMSLDNSSDTERVSS